MILSFATTQILGITVAALVSFSSTAYAKLDRPLELGTVSNTTKAIKDEPTVLMNDPAIKDAWGIQKSNAQKAWEVSQGSRKIVVAVIDTGADVRHEDLTANMWTNPKEIPGNGIDDDKNGFIDDVNGWNFVSHNNNLTDNHGHGTHIAGIIGAQAGNNKGIAGISPKVSLMILKYYDPKVPNTDNLKNTINSIRYAVKNGANIINYSGGGTEFSKEEKEAVEEARKAGVLFVAAAGNERSNSDVNHYYPADYGLSNVISVTAIDPNTQVLPSSNYGTVTVDLAAPGQNILSTLPGNTYGYMTGTSQATAFVTGAAVLAMAHKDEFSPEDVKKYILSTGDSTTSLAMKTKTSRQLNLYKVLTVLDSGVSAAGVKVSNESNTVYAVDAVRAQNNPVNDLSSFGKSLMQTVDMDRLSVK